MTIIQTALSAGASLLGLMTVRANRGFQPASGSMFSAMATIEETHVDEMDITDHPVEYGAAISDHAFRRPSELSIVCGWSDSPNDTSATNALTALGVGVAASKSQLFAELMNASNLVDAAYAAVNPTFSGGQSSTQRIYQQLLDYQQSRVLFSIYTGKRRYQNMLIKSLAVTTDERTENALIVRMTCREILFAQTQTVTAPSPQNMATPEANSSPSESGAVNLVPGDKFNAGAGRGAVNPANVKP